MDHWITAHSELDATATKFLNCSTALRTLALGSVTSKQFSFSLEGTIAQFEQRLDAISKVQERLEMSRRVLNGILNSSVSRVPMHRLPHELISKIFEYCITWTKCSSKRRKYEPRSAILAVCTLWQRIAYATPQLWVHVDIDIRHALKHPSTWLEHMEATLQRSRGALIHLHLPNSSHRSFLPWQHSVLSSLGALLRPHVPRLSSLSFDGHIQDIVLEEVMHLSAPDGSLAPLKRLWVDCAENEPLSQLHWPATLGSHLVELEICSLTGKGAPSMQHLLNMLASATSLRYFRLDQSEFANNPSSSLPKVLLPDLQLVFLHLGGGNLSAVVSSLYPGNQPLDIRLHLDESSGFAQLPTEVLWSSFQALFSRCNVLLLVLPVARFRNRPLLEACLTATPNLRVLFFDVGEDHVFWIFDILVSWIRSDPGSRLAHIQALGFRDGLVVAGDDKLALEMLALRKMCWIYFILTALSSQMDQSYQPYEERLLWGDRKQELRRIMNRVDVIVGDPTDIHHGQDLFMQSLLEDM